MSTATGCFSKWGTKGMGTRRANGVIATIALLMLACWPVAAKADCDKSPVRWHFGKSVSSYWRVKAGSVCTKELRTAKYTTLTGLAISSKASHGIAGRSGLYSIAYRPEPNFKGTDNFTIAIDGSYGSRSGTALMYVSVTVE
jgi:hypothetical protein